MNKKRLVELAGIVEAERHGSKINNETFNEIKYLLSQSSMMRGEERTLSDEEIKKFNSLLHEIITAAKSLHTMAYNAKERYKKKG